MPLNSTISVRPDKTDRSSLIGPETIFVTVFEVLVGLVGRLYLLIRLREMGSPPSTPCACAGRADPRAAPAGLADNLEGGRPATRRELVAASFKRVLRFILSPSIRLIGLFHNGTGLQAEATRRKRGAAPRGSSRARLASCVRRSIR